MDFPVWMLYTLFLLNTDGQNYVIEGHYFNNKMSCVQFGKNNIEELGVNAVTTLSEMYGKNSFKPLEIGCVPRDIYDEEVPTERIPIIAVDWEKKPAGTEL